MRVQPPVERVCQRARLAPVVCAMFTAIALLLPPNAVPLVAQAVQGAPPGDPSVLSFAREYARGAADAAVGLLVDAWLSGPPSWSVASEAATQAGRERVRRDLQGSGLLRAGIALHTETAFWLWKEQHPRAALDHLAIARGWLDGAPGEFVRAWLLTVVAYFQGELAGPEVASLVEWAQTRYRDVPEVWLAQGIMAETAAGAMETASRTAAKDRPRRDLTLAFDRSDLRASLDQWLPLWHAQMASAEKAYAAALQRSPSHPEALLRRGRVLTRLGKVPEGTALLVRAHEATTEVHIRFLAALFLARSHEEEGHVADAESAYARARVLRPRAPSAAVGLLRLQLQRGLHQQAQGTAQSLLEADEGNEADPWWLYDRGLAWQLPQLLRELREVARHE